MRSPRERLQAGMPFLGMVQTRVPPPAKSGATNPGRKSRSINCLMDCIARGAHTHTILCRCHPGVLTFEPGPFLHPFVGVTDYLRAASNSKMKTAADP